VAERVDAARSRLAEHVGSVLDERDLEDFDRIAEKIRARSNVSGSGGSTTDVEKRKLRGRRQCELASSSSWLAE
jgi:hypothetical protein